MLETTNNKLAKITIGLVVPRSFKRSPETLGGGYVRLSRIYRYLKDHANIIEVGYAFNAFRKIIEVAELPLSILLGVRKLRKSGAVAIILGSIAPADVKRACVLSRILSIPYVVFANTIPLTGYVGYKRVRLDERPSLRQTLLSTRAPGKPLLASIIDALENYIMMFRCLERAAIVPLTSEISSTLRKLGYTCVEPIEGIGCLEPRASVRNRWIDAIYVASNLHPDKGVNDVIDVWQEVQREIPSAKLLIVGREDPFFDISTLKNYIYNNKIRNVSLIATRQGIPNEIVLKLMSQAKLFVYPTKKDVTPQVISEALSCGTPVATYDLHGIRLVFGDCNAVIRVDVGNKKMLASQVVRLLKDENELEQLRKEAIKWCLNNTWKKVAIKTIKAYYLAIYLAYKNNARVMRDKNKVKG